MPLPGYGFPETDGASAFQLSHQGATAPTHPVAGIVPPVCDSSWSRSVRQFPPSITLQNASPDAAFSLQFSLLDSSGWQVLGQSRSG